MEMMVKIPKDTKKVILSAATREDADKDDVVGQSDIGGMAGVTDTRSGVNLTVGMCYSDDSGQDMGLDPHVCIKLSKVVRGDDGLPAIAVVPVFTGTLSELVETTIQANILLARIQAEAEANATKPEDPLSKLVGPTKIAG